MKRKSNTSTPGWVEAEDSTTWFWFRLISMACSSDTSKGTFWILLRDRSSRSRFLREPSPDGNSDIWFPDKLSERRALSWPRPGGSLWIWFPVTLRVSSFFSWEISEGRLAEDTDISSEIPQNSSGGPRGPTPFPPDASPPAPPPSDGASVLSPSLTQSVAVNRETLELQEPSHSSRKDLHLVPRQVHRPQVGRQPLELLWKLKRPRRADIQNPDPDPDDDAAAGSQTRITIRPVSAQRNRPSPPADLCPSAGRLRSSGPSPGGT